MNIIFRFLTCLKYFLDKKSKIDQCARDNKFIWCCISVKFQFEMVVLKVLREFAGGTTIHGFTFLVSPKSSSRTKIIWALLLVVAFMYATLEMRNSVVGKYDYIFKTRNLTSDYHCICKNSLVERSIFQIFWKPQYIFSSRNQNCCNISP